MTRLVDTNVLVYRYDARFPKKQEIATALLRAGLEQGDLRVAHQGLLEFVAATTRTLRDGSRLLDPEAARREAEEMLSLFPVLYPNESVFRMGIRGAAAYQLSWFDAQMWAIAEVNGVREMLSEDFQHGRILGSVRIVNPFPG